MNYVDYSSPLVSIQNFTLVTFKVNTIQYIYQYGKLKFFNFKQGRMIPYEVAFL